MPYYELSLNQMLILTSTSALDTSKTDRAGQRIPSSANTSLLQSKLHWTTLQSSQSWKWKKRKGLCKIWSGSEACPMRGGTPAHPQALQTRRQYMVIMDTYGDTLWSCCSGLCWFMVVTKRIISIMNMSLHINKILPLQSPLLLSRCTVMNNGQCVPSFSDDLLSKEISTEAAFMSRIIVTVLNRFFLVSFFFPKLTNINGWLCSSLLLIEAKSEQF